MVKLHLVKSQLMFPAKFSESDMFVSPGAFTMLDSFRRSSKVRCIVYNLGPCSPILDIRAW